MFTIIQSHLTERLVEHLLTAYQSKNQGIFDEFIVIVPSMVLGDWLDKSIASQAGISTLVTTTFWGQYQWTLMQKVLSAHNEWLVVNERAHDTLSVPEVAVLTGSVMQWRLFGYFTYYQGQIIADDTHPLHPLLSALLDDKSDSSQQDIRLWSLATDFARVFSRYLTHREDWLTLWSQDKPVDVETLIKDKDELAKLFDEHAGMTPEWLIAHYVELERAQRHLWRLLFALVYEHRQAIEARFWQIMKSAKDGSGIETGVDVFSILPKQLHIFTLQQLPQNELNFLQKLSTYFDITLLHYNPSQLFWADIVDKQWLQRQQVINPKSVFLRDHGHTLLSRLGKQSRETFAMLAGL
ncbi:exodeoxyribonuclease V subunit gamma, partial [Psychrobacter sp. T6-1]|uniref:exodeoxyribonuclease V subunit gamma n=1 Tax=Psychrobacter sp. T6-1 TaxID=3457447 RepID=UPI003FCF22FC